MKPMSMTGVFAHPEIKPVNPRWCSSAVSEDGGTLELPLWRELFDYPAKPPAFVHIAPNCKNWSDHPCNRDRVWYIKHGGGQRDVHFRWIIACPTSAASTTSHGNPAR